jgi:DNA-binding transcriptional LysR family regulator
MATTSAIRREMENGSLVQVLPDWDIGSVDLQAVFALGRAAKPSARALVAYLAEALADA